MRLPSHARRSLGVSKVLKLCTEVRLFVNPLAGRCGAACVTARGRLGAGVRKGLKTSIVTAHCVARRPRYQRTCRGRFQCKSPGRFARSRAPPLAGALSRVTSPSALPSSAGIASTIAPSDSPGSSAYFPEAVIAFKRASVNRLVNPSCEPVDMCRYLESGTLSAHEAQRAAPIAPATSRRINGMVSISFLHCIMVRFRTSHDRHRPPQSGLKANECGPRHSQSVFEMMLREFVARARLQILLESQCHALRSKPDSDINHPGSETRGRCILAVVVRSQACGKVRCRSDVSLIGMADASENVDVPSACIHRVRRGKRRASPFWRGN